MIRAALVALTLGVFSNSQAQTIQSSVNLYSKHVHSSYEETLRRAEMLRAALREFTATPSTITQTVAKEVWKYARESYGMTEAFRFYNGPIDADGGPEGALNSWPLDEGYIDYVQGASQSGIIGNIADYPVIDKELLNSLNQLDGEKNVSTGYHAIEFLLWGQDFYIDGAGQRSYTDFAQAPNADRRRAYLNASADLLVEQLSGLEVAWRADENNFRAEFESLKDTEALKKILSGVVFMAGDELSGERMYVAYDSQGQEDEQSCFSDMTHMDIIWNYRGVKNILFATKVLELPEVKDTKVAKSIQARLISLEALLFSIPVPFDQAIASESGRAVILNAVEELETLAKEVVEVSKILNAKVDY